MTDQEYRDYPALSNSFLKEFDRSPAHAFRERETTTALEIGSAIHSFILEPEKFDSEYLVTDLDGRSKEYKALIAENEGKTVIKSSIDDFLTMRKNVNSLVYKNDTMKDIIERGEKEKVIFFKLLGESCKGKLDLYYDHFSNTIFDLKTTDNALDFQRSVINYQYYRQAYYYTEGIAQITGMTPDFVFVALEKTKPFGVKMYVLNDDYINLGEIATMRTIEKYIDWKEKGSDKTIIYDNEVELLTLPGWKKI